LSGEGRRRAALYEKFRPEIPPGKKGWGAAGKLDLDCVRKMASPDKRKADLLTFHALQENHGFTARLLKYFITIA
jgi:hypothetical protein